MYDKRLKGLRFCGHTVLPEHNAVFVVSNGEQARYSTLIRCHSVWACPYCASRVMAQKGADIACAIDALSSKYKQSAAMLTFTLPHDFFMSCQDAYQVLHDTWHLFTRRGRRATYKKSYVLKSDVQRRNKTYGDSNGAKNEMDKRAVGKAGDVKSCTIHNKDPWSRCREEIGFQHFVKVYEVTYGENGWHPHIHLLAWVPKRNLQRFKDYEDDFLKSWWKCAKKAALKYWNRRRPDSEEDNKQFIDKMYADYKMAPVDGHRSVYISKDEAGNVVSQKSSYYVSGWSGNMEMTSSCNVKNAREGHYTPFQLLKMSCEDARNEEKYMPLFIEYALATHGHRRVEFSSRTGLTKIIREWKQSEQYFMTIKKKFTNTESVQWKVVAWFDKEQWYDICEFDITTDENVRTTILQLARAPDPRTAIADYVAAFDVILHEYEHPSQQSFERHIFENQSIEDKIAAC